MENRPETNVAEPEFAPVKRGRLDTLSQAIQPTPSKVEEAKTGRLDELILSNAPDTSNEDDYEIQMPTWYGIKFGEDQYAHKEPNVIKIPANSFFGKVLGKYDNWIKTSKTGKVLAGEHWEEINENARDIVSLGLMVGIGANAISSLANSPIGQNFLNRVANSPLFNRIVGQNVSGAEMLKIFMKLQPGGKENYGDLTKKQAKIWEAFQNSSKYITNKLAIRYGVRISPTRGAEIVFPKEMRLPAPDAGVINFYAGMPANKANIGDMVSFGNVAHKVIGLQGEVAILSNLHGGEVNANLKDLIPMVTEDVPRETLDPTKMSKEEYYKNIIPNRKGRREYLKKWKQEKGYKEKDYSFDRGEPDESIHSPADPKSGSPLYDLTEKGTYPEDVYSFNGLKYYGTGEDVMDRKAYSIISNVESSPNKIVTIYRAVEKDGKPIQAGDWVTTVRQYAKEHGESTLKGNYKIVSKTVTAKDLFTSGDSWLEYGYHPQERMPSPHTIKKQLESEWEAANAGKTPPPPDKPTAEGMKKSEFKKPVTVEEKKELIEKISRSKANVELLKEELEFLKSETKSHKNSVGRYKGGKQNEEYNALPVYFRKKGGLPLDVLASESRFESDMEFRDYLVNLYDSKKKAELDLINAKEEHKLLLSDLKSDPPDFKDLTSESFVSQPKKKTSIIQYFTPAEYHLKQLGFDADIGKPIRTALMEKEIELSEKAALIQSMQYDQQQIIPKNELAASNERIFQLMDKGMPKTVDEWSLLPAQQIEIQIAQKYREQTNEMLERMNEVRALSGKAPIRGVKNYILHMLRPEILNEIYANGVIPPELAKIMENIPTKNVFLRTAIERQGVPEEWLVKNPHELMRAMFAIDLRYIHLQKALLKIDPYLDAVKNYVGPAGDYWSPETYKYLDEWVKQAVKMRPSNTDVLIDNLLEHTIAPLLRNRGLKVSHMPWRDFIRFYSSSVHVGAMGMRAKPILRNLVQSTFDWVMYGTKHYLEGSDAMHKVIFQKDKEGLDILNKSLVWKTRTPFEAQEIGGLNKIFNAGSVGYRFSDLHNVGKGILTRYYFAKDVLKMDDNAAIAWADDDLPATQWSYRREDLPRSYWTTTGKAVWTLGSWWQNFYFRFMPEIIGRTFSGKTADGRTVDSIERFAGLRFIILMGVLYGIKEATEENLGIAIDYTGQVGPTLFRESPIWKGLMGAKEVAQAITEKDEKLLKRGFKNMGDSLKLTIPFYLGLKDLFGLLNGDKDLVDVLFYADKKEKKRYVDK